MPGHPDRGPRQAWNLGQHLGLDGRGSLLPLGAWVLLWTGAIAIAVRERGRDDRSRSIAT